MPTVSRYPYRVLYEERGDVVWNRRVWSRGATIDPDTLHSSGGTLGINDWGKTTHASHPAGRVSPYLHEGIYDPCGPGSQRIQITNYDAEGAHEAAVPCLWQDLGIPKQTQLSSATLEFVGPTGGLIFTNSMRPYNDKIDASEDTWRLQVYGIAEDNCAPFTGSSPYYDVTASTHPYGVKSTPLGNGTYGAGSRPGFSHTYRYRFSSASYNRTHTVSTVKFTKPNGGGQPGFTLNVLSVIQEITNRDGWSPNNRLGLVVANDNMAYTASTEDFPPNFSIDYVNAGMVCQMQFSWYDLILTVTW